MATTKKNTKLRVIRWEEPPKARVGRPAKADLTALVTELETQPGTWALVGENSPLNVRKPLQDNGLEVKMRGIKKNRAEVVYARSPKTEA
jgi:hypothetical protein